MDADLAALEEKVSELLASCARLRADNYRLRQQFLAVTQENKQLAARMSSAAERLDRLLNQLPADTQ